MAGSFDAKVDISTADAIANLRLLKTEVKDNTVAFREFNAALLESKGNVQQAAQQMTQLAAARRQNATATKEETANLIAEARQEAINTKTADDHAIALARVGTEEAKTSKATEEAGLASSRAALADQKRADAAKRTEDATNKSNGSLANSRYLMYDVAATYGTMAGLLTAMPALTEAVAASYQKDFAQILRISGQTTDQAATLKQGLKDLGDSIPMSFKDLTDIAQLGAHLQLGNAGLVQFTDTVAKFSVATGVATDTSAAMFSKMKTMFSADANSAGSDYFNKLGSSITEMGTKIVATDQQVTSMVTSIQAVSATAGLSTQATVGLAGAMSSLSIAPEMARGALTRLFASFNRDSVDATGKMQQFGNVIGMSGQQAAELWKTDPNTFFNKLIQGLNTTYKSGGNLTQIFDQLGIKNVRDVATLQRLAVGYDVLNKSQTAAAEGYAKGTALNTLSQPVFETLVAHLQEMATAWKNMIDTIGAGGLGPLTSLVDMIKGVAENIDHLVQQVPAIGVVIQLLMGISVVTAAFLGFKGVQALVMAGMLSFQEAASKGMGTGMTLNNTIKTLAQTMLVSKGATDESSRALLENKTAMQSLITAATTSTAKVKEATAATEAGTVATETNTAATEASNSAFSKVTSGAASFGKGLLSLAGGPIGVAVIGVTALTTAMADSAAEADNAGKAIADALGTSAAAGAQEAVTQLEKIKVSWVDSGAALGNVDKSMVQIAQESGVSFDKVVAAVLKGKDSVTEFNKTLDDLAQSKGYQSFQDMHDKNPTIIGDDGQTVAKLSLLRDKVEEVGKASAQSATDTKTGTDALTAMGDASTATGSAIDDTTTKLDVYTKAFKALNDEVFGTVDAATAVQDALFKLGTSLQKSGSFDPGTDLGRTNLKNFEDAAQKEQDYFARLITDGSATAQQAATGYSQFLQGLINQIKARGGDTSGIEQLANEVSTKFAQAVKADPAQLDVSTNPGQAQAAAADTTKTMQDTANANPVKATVTSDTSAANENVRKTKEYTVSLLGMPFVATVDANTDPATQALQALEQFAASVVNSIIDGINTMNNIVPSWFGQKVAPIGHVGWGEVQAPTHQAAQPAVQPAAVPAAPTQAMPSAAGGAAPDLGNQLAGLANGYNDVADKAAKAGKAGADAAKAMGDGLTSAAAAALDYSNRLKTGLTDAFNMQYGLSSATDAYYTQLNSIVKKRQDEITQVSDLTTKINSLNDARNKDLVDANKAQIEANISRKYGEGDRAAAYDNTAQTALDNAAAKQKEIDADVVSRKTIQDGIGAITGYSDAAIANRQALRDLETKTLDMVAAYAAQGHSVQEVKAYSQQLTAQFQVDAGQVSTNRAGVNGLIGDLSRYTAVINAVPYVKPTTVTANTGPAANELGGIQSQLDRIGQGATATVTWNEVGGLVPIPGDTIANGQQVYNTLDPRTGHYTGVQVYNQGGQVQGFASGGQIPGTPPSNPRADNLMASVDGKGLVRVRSKEFIQPQEAVDYYGLDFMNAIRTMSLPKFNGGGSVGGYGGGSGGHSGVTVVQLNSESLAALQRMHTPVYLMTEDRIIAESASRGNVVLASQGHS